MEKGLTWSFPNFPCTLEVQLSHVEAESRVQDLVPDERPSNSGNSHDIELQGQV